MNTIPDSYIIFVVGSFVALVGWAVRTHFGQKAVETRVAQLETRDTAQDLRINSVHSTLNTIYTELGKIVVKLDAVASSMIRLENRVDGHQ